MRSDSDAAGDMSGMGGAHKRSASVAGLDTQQEGRRTNREFKGGDEALSLSTDVSRREVPGEDDIGPAFLLLQREAYTLPSAHPSNDLLSLSGLDPLAQSVARTDPVSGEKINKLRKSYEGYLKSFNLSGKNKAVKHEGEMSAGLAGDITWMPDDMWNNQQVMGRNLEDGLSDGLLDKLDAAMTMQPGPVVNNDYWEGMLVDDKMVKPPVPGDPASRKAMPVPGNVPGKGKANGVVGSQQQQQQPVANRPQRASKKRRYDDDSYEGYGEGFEDDASMGISGPGGGGVGGAGNYSSGDEGSRRGSIKKKQRRKVNDFSLMATLRAVLCCVCCFQTAAVGSYFFVLFANLVCAQGLLRSTYAWLGRELRSQHGRCWRSITMTSNGHD